MKKNKLVGKIINIHAKCGAFEFRENISETVAEARLIDIRDGFHQLRRSEEEKGKLVVKSVLVNPELNLK